MDVAQDRKLERTQYSKAALFSKVADAAVDVVEARNAAMVARDVAGQIAEHFKAAVQAMHEDREGAFKAIAASIETAAYERGWKERWQVLALQAQRRLRWVLVVSALQTLGTLVWLVSR